MREFDLLAALARVLGSVDGVRNGRALAVLLGTFAGSGLLLAMARSSLARDAATPAWLAAGAALLVAFYGGNTAGIVVMDDARRLSPRRLGAAVRASLATAHRLLLVMAAVALAGTSLGGVLWGLLWTCRTAVSGAVVGPLLFGLVVPVAVVGIGLALLALLVVVVPLAAPAVWAGTGARRAVRLLVSLVRHRLPQVALLMSTVALLTAGAGALVSFGVLAGGRVVAEASVVVVGVDVPVTQLMAGLFGYGLRSLGSVGTPLGSTAHAAAALVGGGVVFALGLLLPSLVYLRGVCSTYLAIVDGRRLKPP